MRCDAFKKLTKRLGCVITKCGRFVYVRMLSAEWKAWLFRLYMVGGARMMVLAVLDRLMCVLVVFSVSPSVMIAEKNAVKSLLDKILVTLT